MNLAGFFSLKVTNLGGGALANLWPRWRVLGRGHYQKTFTKKRTSRGRLQHAVGQWPGEFCSSIVVAEKWRVYGPMIAAIVVSSTRGRLFSLRNVERGMSMSLAG